MRVVQGDEQRPEPGGAPEVFDDAVDRSERVEGLPVGEEGVVPRGEILPEHATQCAERGSCVQWYRRAG